MAKCVRKELNDLVEKEERDIIGALDMNDGNPLIGLVDCDVENCKVFALLEATSKGGIYTEVTGRCVGRCVEG